MINKKISILIPCHNEEDNIPKTYTRLVAIVSKITKQYEIIFIDDGSDDSSLTILKKFVSKDSHVKVISLSRRFGPHGAYAAGFSYSTGDAIVCIDCDLQDPPELIPKMVTLWKEGHEVVYGIRAKREGDILRRNLVKLYYRIMKRLSTTTFPLDTGDFGLVDRKVVDLFNKMPEHNKYYTGLRAWVGFKQIGIPYKRADRKLGGTKFGLIDYFRWASNNITSFSYKPLEFIFYLAALVMILLLLGIAVYLFNPYNNTIVILLGILFIGLLQLVSVSIIAQYLINIFDETKNRPNFIVKEVFQKSKKN